MIRKGAISVSVDDPSRGLLTRVPSNQPSKKGPLKGAFAVAQNVRFDDGVVRNAPGFEEIWTHCWPEGTINLIFQEALLQGGDGFPFPNPFVCTSNRIYWIQRDVYNGDLLPCDIDSEEAFGTPTMGTALNQSIAPEGIGTNEVFGGTLAGWGILPSGISSGEAFGTAAAFNDQDVAPSSVASVEVFGDATVAGTAPPIVTSGLVYRLEPEDYAGGGTWTAQVGANATATSMTTAGGFPVFSGTGVVDTGRQTDIEGNAVYTISIWAKLTDNTGTRPIYTYDNDNIVAGPTEIYLFWSSGAGADRFNYGGGDGEFNVRFGADSDWHQFVMVRDGNNATSAFYIDGVFVSNRTVSGLGAGGLGYTFRLGPAENVSGWVGNMGELLIYNRVLSAGEVTTNWDALRANYGL